MPKRHVQVRVVDVQAEEKQGSDVIPFINEDRGNMPEKELDDEKRIPTPSSTVERLILDIFGEDADIALALSFCESGLRADAVGDHAISYVENGIEYGKSYGLFQIRYLPGRPTPEQLLNPEFNVKFAKQMYDAQGGDPWSVFNGSCYKSKLSSL